MNRRLALGIALLLVGALNLPAQRPATRRCLLQVLNVDREGFRDQFGENTNYFAGGDVRLRCANQPIFLKGDSIASIGGSVIQLFTGAQYRDDDIEINGDTLIYYKNTELLQARGSVRIINKLNGSTLEGPWVDYLRAVRGIRDSAETTALQRPTVTYRVARAAGDTVDPAPYVIVAEGMRGRGSSQLNGWGDVTIDRDSLAGRGDSVSYSQGDHDRITLTGNLASLVRRGVDSFSVNGTTVVLGLDGEALRSVEALGSGHILGSTGEIVSDSASLEFADGKLVATRAWDRTNHAQVLASGYDVRGDSVAIDTPDERLRELRVFGNGRLVEPDDSTAADSIATPADSSVTPESTATATDSAAAPVRNTMTGGRLTVRFVDYDSAGTLQSQLVDITAIGQATSLFSRDVMRNGRLSPTINYTRADTIIVVMRTGDSTGVHEVRAFGNVDGLQLEQETLRRPRTTALPSLGPVRREEAP